MKKIAILYGAISDSIQAKAVEVLSRFLMDYTKSYPVCFAYDCSGDYSQYRCIYIGTKQNNAYIAHHSEVHLTRAEEYCISVKNDTVMIQGFDDAGVLYGCVDFYNQYVIRFEYAHAESWCSTNYYWRNIFEAPLPDFTCRSAPSVQRRGIWTWGHVIYDYRRFMDHMVLLKMNTMIIWNDFAPANAKQMIEYAHSCGIQIIWGVSWGWDDGCKNLSLKALEGKSQEILHKFQKEYGNLAVDGLYFQSITELETEYLGGILVAQAVTDFVNKTAKLFFDSFPGLELQFGLHATSVRSRLEIIKKVDPRIRIVWEDCGAFPFSYFPHNVDSFEATKEFVEIIANLRGTEDRFGVVTKGFTKLEWPKFTHLEGPIFLGAGSDNMKTERIAQKSRDWKYFQAYWLRNGKKALEMVKAMTDKKRGDLIVTALVEDGMFEDENMYPVALYAQMLWDCNADYGQILSDVALRSYVSFA